MSELLIISVNTRTVRRGLSHLILVQLRRVRPGFRQAAVGHLVQPVLNESIEALGENAAHPTVEQLRFPACPIVLNLYG